MWQFNENFMESCINANPAAFLREELTPVDRQPELGAFRPDLILCDSDGDYVIVEIQQQALDRYHLYKCLEYRDLVEAQRKCQRPRVILVCENIEDRYRPLLETHRIELCELPRRDFVRIAVQSCPEVVTDSLCQIDEETQIEERSGAKARSSTNHLIFRPLDWFNHLRPHDVLGHLYHELGRLDVNLDAVPRERYRTIVLDIESFLDPHLPHELGQLANLSSWNLDSLRRRAEQEHAGTRNSGDAIAKPRIELAPYITARGNLSVVWRPRWDGEEDWKYWCGEESYGWQRPANELLFVRNVQGLRPGLDNMDDWDSRVNWHVLDEIFIALVRSTFKFLFDLLSVFLEVRLINDFEFVTREEPLENDTWHTQTRIIGWEIYNLEVREREEEHEWLDAFEKTYGIAPEKFIEACSEALRNPKRAAHNLAKHVACDLSREGVRITAGQAGAIIKRLKQKHPHLTKTFNVT